MKKGFEGRAASDGWGQGCFKKERLYVNQKHDTPEV